MHPLVRIPYSAAGALTRLAVRAAPERNSKFFRAMSARRGLVERYTQWASASRDESRPLLWIHAPSVGEGLQALPVIQRFREREPHAQVVYTFFSPSAERFAAST